MTNEMPRAAVANRIIDSRQRKGRQSDRHGSIVADRPAIVDLGQLAQRHEARVSFQGMDAAVAKDKLAHARMKTSERSVIDGLSHLGCREAVELVLAGSVLEVEAGESPHVVAIRE